MVKIQSDYTNKRKEDKEQQSTMTERRSARPRVEPDSTVRGTWFTAGPPSPAGLNQIYNRDRL